MLDYWKTSLKAMADMALPRHCVACDRPLYLFEKHLCLPCMAGLPFTHFETLSHNPMADRLNEVLQRRFSGTEDGGFEGYVFATALFYYNADSDYRHITPQLKYYRDFSCGRFFAAMLARRIRLAKYLDDVDLVVPVPLHWTRRRQRGYNQAEIIAREIVKELDVKMVNLLKRRRRTRSQTALDVAGKAGNVLGAFALRPRYIRPLPSVSHILLIDDVFTTGATLAACHAALRQAFPPSVRISVATIAYVSS